MTKSSELMVLIVDDEPDILELIEEEFSDAGYKTITATCGNDAVKLVQSNKIDIVLSDYRMPNGNGMVILEEVNKIPQENRPLFFFISGHADISIQEALDAGAKKFFTKPFDFENLLEEINQYVG